MPCSVPYHDPDPKCMVEMLAWPGPAGPAQQARPSPEERFWILDALTWPMSNLSPGLHGYFPGVVWLMGYIIGNLWLK